MMPVMLIDDSIWVRERLAAAIGEIEGLAVVGGTGDPSEALLCFKALRPDVVILDIRLPGGNGIDLLREIKRLEPATRVIMFTSNDHIQYRTQCLRAGADHFLSKADGLERLCELLANLAAGHEGAVHPGHEGATESATPLKIPP